MKFIRSRALLSAEGRMPREGWLGGARYTLVLVAVLLLPPMVGHPAAGPVPGTAPTSPALLPRTVPIHVHTTNYSVFGSLTGFGHPPSPLGGYVVTLADQLCSGTPSPSTCPKVNSTLTNISGQFSFAVPNGSYFVYLPNSSVWGGDFTPVTVAGSPQSVSLRVYPWVPYGNATFVLPAWNNLSGQAANCNAAIPCRPAPYGTQVPVLSWTQDGAIYVNATDQLVFYSFVNRSVERLASWLPLYDNLMSYDGIENTEWATQDGAYVYEFGCLAVCTNSSVVTFYGVNLSTGRTFEHNFTGLNAHSFYVNGQVNLIGLDGNDSIAAVVLGNGSVYAYGLWNGTQWVLGLLPFFEANNLYWLPLYNSYIDVQAMGSTADALDEYLLTGAGAGSSLVQSYAGHFASGYVSNGVDGLFVNVSSHEFLVTESKKLGDLRSQRFGLNSAGTIASLLQSYPGSSLGAWPSASSVPNSYSSEHRPSLVASGPMFMGFWDGFFNNNSWMYDPATGGYLSTNISFDGNSTSSPVFREEHQNPNQVEGLFFNTTYSILGASVDCQSGGLSCPIRGTSPGTRAGTVWWSWKLGQPEFPYPASAGRAETLPPGPLAVSASNSTTTVTLNWTAPATGADPILNYTVFAGPRPGAWTSIVSLPSGNRSFTLHGLVPGESVAYALLAWNLHWHNSPAAGVENTHPRARLIASFLADRTVDDVGIPLTLHVALSGHPAGPQYSYVNLPPGCPSVNGPLLVCDPSGAGVYPLTVLVSDVNGSTDYANLTLTVNPYVAVEAWSVPSPIGTNSTTTFSIGLGSTGTAPFVVLWRFGDGATGSGPASAHAYVSPGTYLVSASVVDGAGGSTNYSSLVQVLPAIQLTASASPDPVEVNLPIALTVQILKGGVAPFTFAWSLPGANATAVMHTSFSSAGSFSVSVVVTDSIGLRSTSNLTVTVAPSPVLTNVNANPSATDVGRPVYIGAEATGGVAPYTVQYLGLPTSCPSLNALRFVCAPEAIGNYTIRVLLTDALGIAALGATALDVNPPLAVGRFVASPDPATTNSTIVLSLVAVGGTPPLSAAFPGLPGGCRTGSGNGSTVSCRFASPGSYFLAATLNDSVGGSVATSLSLLVLSPGSTGSTRPQLGNGVPAWFYPATIGLLIALLGGVAWLLFRARPPSGRAEKEDGPPMDSELGVEAEPDDGLSSASRRLLYPGPPSGRRNARGAARSPVRAP
ncbi:MAG: PKD domain-containing protein [Thermoplasmata archaeon]|nr:PKD domain-containing protein [Thermoplasmata archaeon]